jgi:fatty acid/phospholipid biosynthesis enzyme
VLVGHGAADSAAVHSAIRRADSALQEELTAHIGAAISEAFRPIPTTDT